MQELRCCNWSATYATSFVFVTCACVRHVRAEFAKYDQGAKVRPELEAAQASARGGGEANEPELLCRWSARKLPVAMDRSGSRPSENAQLILRRYDTFDFEAEKSKTSNLHAWKLHVVSSDFRSADVFTQPRSGSDPPPMGEWRTSLTGQLRSFGTRKFQPLSGRSRPSVYNRLQVSAGQSARGSRHPSADLRPSAIICHPARWARADVQTASRRPASRRRHRRPVRRAAARTAYRACAPGAHRASQRDCCP